MYPAYLWLRTGIGAYLSDYWNVIEFFSYLLFMASFVMKVMMHLESIQLFETLPAVLAGDSSVPLDMGRYAQLQNWYMNLLAPNCIL